MGGNLMDLNKIKEIWNRINESASIEQLSGLMDILIEKSNFAYHHNFIIQILDPKNAYLERIIHVKRQCLKIMNKNLRDEGDTFYAIDFMIQDNASIFIVFDKDGDIRQYIFKRSANGYIWALFDIRRQLKRHEIRIYERTTVPLHIYEALFKIWNIKWKSYGSSSGIMDDLKRYLPTSYQSFYLSENVNRIDKIRQKRKIELIKRKRFLDNINIKEIMFDQFICVAEKEWKIKLLMDLNHATGYTERYYKYGIKNKIFDMLFIDCFILDNKYLFCLTNEFYVLYFSRKTPGQRMKNTTFWENYRGGHYWEFFDNIYSSEVFLYTEVEHLHGHYLERQMKVSLAEVKEYYDSRLQKEGSIWK